MVPHASSHLPMSTSQKTDHGYSTVTHTLISIPTNDQKKDWFLKLNSNQILFDWNPVIFTIS